MSFNINYWSQRAYGGNEGGSWWNYWDETDNIASLTVSSCNTGYFQRAHDTYGIHAKRGDVIFATYCPGVNTAAGASTIMLTVPQDWDANGASVIPNAGRHA